VDQELVARARLAAAIAPVRPLPQGLPLPGGLPQPLYPGVVQYGDFAIAEASGAYLARAPDDWMMGCACQIERRWPAGSGPDVEFRSWLDPLTGQALHVEAVVNGDTGGFQVAPRRWVEAALQAAA
jgi:N-methylhydantoinase B